MKFVTFKLSGDEPLTSLDQNGQRHAWAAPPADSEPLKGETIYQYVVFSAKQQGSATRSKDFEEMVALGQRIAIIPRQDEVSPSLVSWIRSDIYHGRPWAQASRETKAYFDKRAVGGRLLKRPYVAPQEQSATTTLVGSLAVAALVATLVATSGVSNKPKLALAR